MPQITTGLDIGTSNIKCVVVSKERDGSLSVVTALKQPSEGFKKGILSDVDGAMKVLREIMIDLKKISKKATGNIFININGEYIKSRFSRGIVAVSKADREIQQDDIDRANEASKAVKFLNNYIILHNIVSEYFVDDVGEIKDPLGMTGGRLEVEGLIVEAFAPHFNLLNKTVNKTGGDASGVVFNPLADERSVLSKRQKDLGVLLIDLGAGTTSFSVYEEGKSIYTKSIPVGSSHVTNDIAIGFKVPVEVAEKLKLMYGYAISQEVSKKEKIKLSDVSPEIDDGSEKSRRFLAEIIEVRLEEIFDFINNELKNIGHSVRLPAGVVLVGGGSKIPGIEDLAKKSFKLSSSLGYPDVEEFEVLNPAHQDLIEDPEFAGAMGLALRGVDQMKSGSSFLKSVKDFLKNLVP